MLYKPNYCCNCGEKIERKEWNLLTSRRFCEVCSSENKKHDHLTRAVAAAGVLGAVFGIGSIFGGGNSTATPVRGFREPVAEQVDRGRLEERTSETLRKESEPASQIPVSPSTIPPIVTGRPDEQFALQKEKPVTPTYYCGALTKKGTPCSRKVKKQGARCWQHEGISRTLPEN